MSKTIIFFRSVLVLLTLWFGSAVSYAANSVDLEVFVREGCPHCAKAEAFLQTLQQEQPNLKVVIHDLAKEPTELQHLKQIGRAHV